MDALKVTTKNTRAVHFLVLENNYAAISAFIKAVCALLYAAMLPLFRIGIYNDDALHVIVARHLWNVAVAHPLLGVKPDGPMPGLALLLSPFARIVDPSWGALKLVSLAVTVATVFLFEIWCRRWLSKSETLAALALFAFNPVVAKFSGIVMTAPYYSFTVLGCFCLMGLLFDRPSVRTAVALGGMLGWAALLRPEGALLSACVLAGVYVGRVGKKYVWATLAPIGGWLAFFIFWSVSLNASRTEFSSDIAALADYWPGHLHAVFGLCIGLPRVFLFDMWWALKNIPLPIATTLMSFAVVGLAALFVAGIVDSFAREVSRRAELGAITAFAASYFVVHVFWHVELPRYMVPLFPVVLLFVVRGAEKTLFRRRPLSAAAAVAVLLGSFAYENAHGLYSYYLASRTTTLSPWQTFEWIGANTPPSARITSSMAPGIELYAARHSAGQIKAGNADLFYYVLMKNGFNYVVVNHALRSVTPGVGDTDDPNLVWKRYRRWINMFPKRFELAYSNERENTQVSRVIYDAAFITAFEKFMDAVRDFEKGSYPEAFSKISEALVLYPELGCGRNLLGALYLFKGDAEKAERAFLDAVTYLPDSSFEALNLATLYHRRGEIERSLVYIDKGLQISVLNGERENYMEDVRVLRQRWENGRALLFIDSPDPRSLSEKP